MPGLVPAIHSSKQNEAKTWTAGRARPWRL